MLRMRATARWIFVFPPGAHRVRARECMDMACVCIVYGGAIEVTLLDGEISQ